MAYREKNITKMYFTSGEIRRELNITQHQFFLLVEETSFGNDGEPNFHVRKRGRSRGWRVFSREHFLEMKRIHEGILPNKSKEN